MFDIALTMPGALILGQRPKHTEQEGALGRGRISLRGQRAQGHAPRVQGHDNLPEVRERPAEPVQLPYNRAIAGLDRGQRLLETRATIAWPTGLVGKQLPRIHARLEHRVAGR